MRAPAARCAEVADCAAYVIAACLSSPASDCFAGDGFVGIRRSLPVLLKINLPTGFAPPKCSFSI